MLCNRSPVLIQKDRLSFQAVLSENQICFIEKTFKKDGFNALCRRSVQNLKIYCSETRSCEWPKLMHFLN
jgi:hypothetical protein